MAIRKYYLVDTENVGSVWKLLLEDLTKRDTLMLFYTGNSPSVSYPDLNYILNYAGSFEMMECYTGKNGLDFQLVSYLGYLLKTAAKTDYIILSNDVGYDPVIKYWNDRGCSITRMTVSELKKAAAKASLRAKENVNAQETSKVEDTNEENLPSESVREPNPAASDAIARALDQEHGEDSDVVRRIETILVDYDLTKLQKVYQTFVKTFGHEEGTKLYQLIKPQIRHIYEMLNQ